MIVGAGLAGTCSALHLADRHRVLLLDSDDPPSGATSAAAGLVSPFMARKARPVWRHRDALRALASTLELAGAADLLSGPGVLRPARSREQAAFFREAGDKFVECIWYPRRASLQRYPSVRAPHGTLLIQSGGAMNIEEFIRRAHDRIRAGSAHVRLGVAAIDLEESNDAVSVRLSTREIVHCRRLVLACGAGFTGFCALRSIPLHPVKGQTVEVRLSHPPTGLPHLSGSGYVVFGETTAIVGSSFDHGFTDLAPDPTVGRQLVARAAGIFPELSDGRIVAHRAGVRVTVDGSRLPIVGPVPGHDRVWVFSGLGSKGLLTAPLLASELASYFDDRSRIPPEIQVSG